MKETSKSQDVEEILKSELKKIDLLKDEFISIVSHEIRTPLTSIHGALELLMTQSLTPEEQKELLNLAYRNSKRLTRHVKAIFETDNFEFGELNLIFKRFSLNDLIEKIFSIYQQKAQSYEVTLQQKLPFPPLLIEGDSEQLLQAIKSLISNAIKFSPRLGTVRLSLEADKDIAHISVHDEGSGINTSDYDKIFKKFTQLEPCNTRSNQGIGLGLNLCKKIIEGHGGKILFDSKPNQGTTFYVQIPLLQKNLT